MVLAAGSGRCCLAGFGYGRRGNSTEYLVRNGETGQQREDKRYGVSVGVLEQARSENLRLPDLGAIGNSKMSRVQEELRISALGGHLMQVHQNP